MTVTKNTKKPMLGFWQIWNLCFGFMGIQFGFELQVGNVSRIFQTLGANIDDIAILWVAAPLTGLIVQPIIGYMSDRTWSTLGRRRPYFFYGAILSTLALLIMPNSSVLWMAAGMLWIMDASFNVAMEPFRALVGDMLPKKQQALGFAFQTFFIGVGATVAGALPWVMTNIFNVPNVASDGAIPPSVMYTFYTGGAVLLTSVLWTVFKTKEYSPDELAAFNAAEATLVNPQMPDTVTDAIVTADVLSRMAWKIGAAGVVLTGVITWYGLDWKLSILTYGAIIFSLTLFYGAYQKRSDKQATPLIQITDDLIIMPRVMRQLAVVQLFSWFAMFAMWSYTTPAVTSYHFGAMDTVGQLYNTGADWAALLGASRNVVTIIAAIFIALLVEKIGRRKMHALNLTLGSIGFLSFYLIENPDYLIISMGLVGFAWASILSIPYSLLSSALDFRKMGLYMGIFNFFIVIPQIIAAVVLGPILQHVFNGQAIYGLMLAGGSLFIAAVAVLFIKTEEAQDQAGHK